MRFSRSQLAAVALPALAVLTVTGLAGQHHGHPAAATGGPAALPSFTADHVEPDGTVHIEASTPVEHAPCVGCLLRHQRPTLWLAAATAALAPGPAAVPPATLQHTAGDALRLPSGRAPPTV